MNKELLKEAFIAVTPLAIILTGIVMSHTGTDLIILGSALMIYNQLYQLNRAD
jgi:hypothetical protein